MKKQQWLLKHCGGVHFAEMTPCLERGCKCIFTLVGDNCRHHYSSEKDALESKRKVTHVRETIFFLKPPTRKLMLQSRVDLKQLDAAQKLADKYCKGNLSLWVRVAALNFRPLLKKKSNAKIKKRK